MTNPANFLPTLLRLKDAATRPVDGWDSLREYAKAITDLREFLFNHADAIAELVQAVEKRQRGHSMMAKAETGEDYSNAHALLVDSDIEASIALRKLDGNKEAG